MAAKRIKRKRKGKPTRAPARPTRPRKAKSSRPVVPAKPKRAPAKPQKAQKTKPAKPAKVKSQQKPRALAEKTRLADRTQLSKRELARRERARLDARNKAARERRKALRDAELAAEARHQERLARRRERYRERRDRELREPPDEVAIAAGWLEHIRNHMAAVFAVSLEVVEAGGGHADHDGPNPTSVPRPPRSRQAHQAAETPWLIVGRFEPMETIGYAELGRGLQTVYGDLPLMVSIGEQRLSQIRIVFHDPGANRRDGDSVISKIGGWDFVVSETIRDLLGGHNANADDPDEESLAARYKDTAVPKFYVFFANHDTGYRDRSPGAETMTIKLRGKA